MTPPAAPVADTALTAGAHARFLCHCLKVREDEVRTAVHSGCRSVQEVTMLCGAGGGCTACHRKIRRVLPADE
ncbi:(2Fe-2S)-binding protein [Stratiformator vulcanicus]|nr:(2Fe-2S)-binding protein [Stratiformator vulcanicus]